MMQAFRNSAKVAGAIFALLMLIFVLTSVDWGGLDHEHLGRQDQRPERRRPHLPGGSCSRRIDNRQRESPASLTLEDRNQIEDQVWEQFVQNGVLDAEYQPARHHGHRGRDRRGHAELAAAGLPQRPRVPDRQPVRPGQVPALAHLQRRRRSTSRRSRRSTATRSQRSKLLRVVTADIYLSDAALWEQYRDEHEQVKIAPHRDHPAQRRPRLRGHA